MRRYTLTLLVVFLAVVSASEGVAHGVLVSTFPKQGSNAAPIPTLVWLQFDGKLQKIEGTTINTIDVIDSAGLNVSFGDPIIEDGRISSRVSGQSVAGVFTVNYRIVSEDGHPVEGRYTFYASPNYVQSEPATSLVPQTKSSLPVGAIALCTFLFVFLIGLLAKKRKEKS